jgi:hypothetical protein
MSRNTLIILYVLMGIALLVCLIDMPYGFYILVRFAAMCAFVICAYGEYTNGYPKYAIVFVVLALLFQPFFKIALGRVLWNIVDVVVVVFLFYRAIMMAKVNRE